MLFMVQNKKKQIFSYKICMPFAWIILIKARLTNQFFPRNVLWTLLQDPSLLTEKHQWPKIPKNQIFST